MFMHFICPCIHISYVLTYPYVYAFYMSALRLIETVHIKMIFYKDNKIVKCYSSHTFNKHLTIVSLCCLFLSFCMRKMR